MDKTGEHHIKHLDGLRGIAILLVLSSHLTDDTFLEKYFKLGWTGVDLFFVLSGFLITGILLDTKSNKGYFRVFFARRALRILPIYYAVLILCFVLSPHFSIISWFRDYQIYFWTYTHNYLIAEKGFFTVPLGHFWSLAIEEQFYIFWPFIVYLLKPKHLIAVIILLIGTGIIIRSYHPVLPFASVFTPAHLDGLLMGAGIATLMRINKAALLKFAPYLLMTATIIIFPFLISEKPWTSYSKTFISFGFAIISLFYSGLLAFSFINTPLRKALSAKAFVLSGKYSYGIYVYHAIIINVTKYYYPQLVHDHRTIVYTFLLIITFALSYLSYHSIEKYFLKMKPDFK